MERNLDRRVEAVVPVEDQEAQQRIGAIIEVMFADDRRSWQLGADGAYHRTEELTGIPGTSTPSRCFRRARRPRPRRISSGHGDLMPGRLSRSEGIATVAGDTANDDGRKVEIELKYEVAVAGGGTGTGGPDLALSRRSATSAPRGSKTATSIGRLGSLRAGFAARLRRTRAERRSS